MRAALFFTVSVACHDDVALEDVRKRPDGPWARAVTAIATPDGVRLGDLSQHRSALEDYLGWASTHGQHTNSWGESREDRRLAYLLNVHNAAVLHYLLRHELPDSPDAVTFGMFQWPGRASTGGPAIGSIASG